MAYNPYYNLDGGQGSVNDRVPLQQPQQHVQQQQQQPQQGSQMNVGPAGSMAFQLGQNAFSSFIGQENFSQFQETVSRAATGSAYLSHYFQVSTSFVFAKIRQILLPFLKGNNWQRTPAGGPSGNGASGTGPTVTFLSPIEDENSPDMYVPLMALVTYILVWNIKQGLAGAFNPENLYYKLSSILAFVALDLCILKLGLYLLVHTASPTASVTELTCYVGYKFVPLTLALLLPKKPRWVGILGTVYLFVAFGVFLLRSVKFNLFNDAVADIIGVKKSTVKQCNYFLFVYGFVWQSVLMWLMA
ncbi:protein transporter YIF1 KNAG_0F00530 [Huiozyma naganishii CBS 8797]|uniref:Protein YIF1 n=1 Tax=Huiozyma naganishii (strain ATCC MYA-139 / BCRC 22969 / CBS 8797 / KCTC 17520 / NBRC 10181 / NCYC 3082 / Yp74L-3) TaxID=1071383 RepID=J7RZQ6_HUIN7|nr:hypothetical protein KNAG_0F00530 [Kazachstania naganishii CBS 8797]CCK70722.1 hypothetical protein KNAG_0F00530 [Kazachstania naganishii CBS 8797]